MRQEQESFVEVGFFGIRTSDNSFVDFPLYIKVAATEKAEYDKAVGKMFSGVAQMCSDTLVKQLQEKAG
ncbi:MAG: hypothetical protein FWD58_04995 [Firmicutes bacterium]|nr:hypothetical protein [Bacillota bacterium]